MMRAWGQERYFEFDIGKTALLMIDMQKDFISPDGACAAAGCNVERYTDLIRRLKNVLDSARGAGCLIAHTQYGFRPNLSDLNEVARLHSRSAGSEYGTQGPLGRILVEGEIGFEIVNELLPFENELVLRKTSFGAFATTDLEYQLKSYGITHLILCGITTSCCVESTLREAVDRGFFCCTLADGAAALEPWLHENTLEVIQSEKNIFGWIASCQELILALSSSFSKNTILCPPPPPSLTTQ